MSKDIILALIAIISGGSLTTIINMLLSSKKNRIAAREKQIDDRIAAWQKISDKNEERLARVEGKLENCENSFRSLERYNHMLEQVIVDAGLSLKIPLKPTLDNESLTTITVNAEHFLEI